MLFRSIGNAKNSIKAHSKAVQLLINCRIVELLKSETFEDSYIKIARVIV